MQLRIQELISINEKYRIENQRSVDNYKSKYSTYKNKLRSANTNI
jgi:hypothetical protein